MKASEFVASLEGKLFDYVRHNLANGVADSPPKLVKIDRVINTDVHMVLAHNGWNCYDDHDCLFTFDYGVYVAVVRSGAGHLWCDRFAPVTQSQAKQG